MSHACRQPAAPVALLVTPLPASVSACTGSVVPRRKAPDHLLILVFDQMRPDYVDRFDLPNFRTLRDSSRHYRDAYVGHLGSQTVVSHLVIPTGPAAP